MVSKIINKQEWPSFRVVQFDIIERLVDQRSRDLVRFNRLIDSPAGMIDFCLFVEKSFVRRN